MASGDGYWNGDVYVKSLVGRTRGCQRGDRVVFYIRECPLKDCCSDKAWCRNKPWSFDTKEGAIDMLKMHLINSSLHQLDEADAQRLSSLTLTNVALHSTRSQSRRNTMLENGPGQ